jgi:hypothetical protein
MKPNPLLKPTCHSMRFKPGPRHMVRHRSPSLKQTLRAELSPNVRPANLTPGTVEPSKENKWASIIKATKTCCMP